MRFQYLLLSGEVAPQHLLHISPRNKPGAKKSLSFTAIETPPYFCELKKYLLGGKKRDNLEMDQVSFQSFFMPVNISLTLQYIVTPQKRLTYMQSYTATLVWPWNELKLSSFENRFPQGVSNQ